MRPSYESRSGSTEPSATLCIPNRVATTSFLSRTVVAILKIKTSAAALSLEINPKI